MGAASDQGKEGSEPRPPTVRPPPPSLSPPQRSGWRRGGNRYAGAGGGAAWPVTGGPPKVGGRLGRPRAVTPEGNSPWPGMIHLLSGHDREPRSDLVPHTSVPRNGGIGDRDVAGIRRTV